MKSATLDAVVPAPAQYKNSTPIPPSVIAPDEVETPFGTVHLEDGFPDKDSADKLYNMLDFQRAVQGYLLGLPPVSVWGLRKGALEWGPANSTVPIFEEFLFWRSFLVDGSPAPGVEAIKKFTKIYPLSEAAHPTPMKFVNVTGKVYSTLGPADYSFWEALNEVVQQEPTDSIDPTTLGIWASIGIQKGKPFAPDARMKKILVDAARVGDASARTVLYRGRNADSYLYPNSAWRLAFLGGYQFEENGARLLDACSSFHFYATGVTPAMDSKDVGVGSQYMTVFVDSKGDRLDGAKNYKLHLPKDIPAKDFWSIILYDNQTRSMLQTNQDWPAVSSQTKGLQTNPDGSVDVYFGPKAPAEKESNWIETDASKGWNAVLRLYGPLQPWFDKTWRPGEIEREL